MQIACATPGQGSVLDYSNSDGKYRYCILGNERYVLRTKFLSQKIEKQWTLWRQEVQRMQMLPQLALGPCKTPKEMRKYGLTCPPQKVNLVDHNI